MLGWFSLLSILPCISGLLRKLIIAPEYAMRSCVKGLLDQQLQSIPVDCSQALEFGSAEESSSDTQGVEVDCFTSSKYLTENDQSLGTDENKADFPSKCQENFLSNS